AESVKPLILPALLGIAAAIVTFIAETAVVIAQNVLKWASSMVGWLRESVIPSLPGPLRDIANIFTSAFQVIASIIQGALTLILGIIKTAISVIQGDWSG